MLTRCQARRGHTTTRPPGSEDRPAHLISEVPLAVRPWPPFNSRPRRSQITPSPAAPWDPARGRYVPPLLPRALAVPPATDQDPWAQRHTAWFRKGPGRAAGAAHQTPVACQAPRAEHSWHYVPPPRGVDKLGGMPPTDALAPESYVQFLADLKAQVSTAQRQAQRVVNTVLIDLCWNIEHRILKEQECQG